MSKEVYVIKKTMRKSDGKKLHILMTNGQSEILEMKNKNVAKKFIEVLNENSDSGWSYSLHVIFSR
jgi:hypothetical protein